MNDQERLAVLKEQEKQLSEERHKHYAAISRIDFELMVVRSELQKEQDNGSANPQD